MYNVFYWSFVFVFCRLFEKEEESGQLADTKTNSAVDPELGFKCKLIIHVYPEENQFARSDFPLWYLT